MYLHTDECSLRKKNENGWVPSVGGGLITLYAVSQIPFVNIIETILFADIHTQNDFFPCLALCIFLDGILVATSWHIMSVCLSSLLFCESHHIVMYILT